MTAPRGCAQIEPRDVHERLSRGEWFRLIDVREPLEHRIARIDGAELIPLGDLASFADRFDREEEIVLLCHHGIRSASACAFLRDAGFTRVMNMIGGIDLWSVDVDPTVPRY